MCEVKSTFKIERSLPTVNGKLEKNTTCPYKHTGTGNLFFMCQK